MSAPGAGLYAAMRHDIDTLSPDEMRHALIFAFGHTPAAILAALESVERERARRARSAVPAQDGDR